VNDRVIDPLDEHRAALAKIDATVAQMSARAGDALSCKRGCDACCVGGLSVLPVEAALIEALGTRPPAQQREGMCAFLDDDGACTVYEARPVLCRTHGLALRGAEDHDGARSPRDKPWGSPEHDGRVPSRGLRVLNDDVSACSLNYTARAPEASEVLDATKLMMLLVTVDRRYRARVGMDDDTSRIALSDLANQLRGTAKFVRKAR
jgi:Fe-S-cluster containining protein